MYARLNQPLVVLAMLALLFVPAGPSTALAHSPPARSAPEPVSVMDFGATCNGFGNDSAAFQAALDDALVVRVPSVTCVLSSNVRPPVGRTLILEGTIKGAGKILPAGSFKLLGHGTVDTSLSADYWLSLAAGDIEIAGIRFSGQDAFVIGLLPSAAITSLNIHDNVFRFVRYGILRNSSTSYVLSAIIANNQFDTITGDAIEWNIGPTDRRLRISGNVVNNVNSATKNGGIGIGVSGAASYSENWSEAMQDFEITGNLLTNMRQAIHVEKASRFGIRGNTIRGISDAYSPTTGIAAQGIAVYGSYGFEIVGNRISDSANSNSNAIFAGFGVTSDVYSASNRDFSIRGNFIVDAGDVTVQAANSDFEKPLLFTFTGNVIYRGKLEHTGACDLIIKDNVIKTAIGRPQLSLNYNAMNLGARFRPNFRLTLQVINNLFADEYGRPEVRIANVEDPTYANNLHVDTWGNNFTISSNDLSAQPVNRAFFTDTGDFPYGREFQVGDVIIDTQSNRHWIVTGAGSRNRANDTFAVVDAAGGVLRSTNFLWTTRDHHYVGQKIRLNAGGKLTTEAIVKRIYIAASEVRMNLVDPRTGVPLHLGKFVAGTITASNPVTYTGELQASTIYNPPILLSGAGTSIPITVIGASLGDFALASFSNSTEGMLVTANITGKDLVMVRFHNGTERSLDLSPGTLSVRVWRR